jgi:uncharacterized protein
MNMIKRDLYLDRLITYIDKPLIKVITGVRRSGKSVIMSLLRDVISSRKVPGNRIITVNFENFSFSGIKEGQALCNYIKSLITGKERHYIFIDEIQEAAGWEQAINSLSAGFNTDIYISASASGILSSKLSTLLTRPFVNIEIQTLSFSEFLIFRENLKAGAATDLQSAFDLYLKLGGFPLIHTSDYNNAEAYKVIYDIYSSALLRDTIRPNGIRDIDLLERVVKYVFDNIGQPFSVPEVAAYFKSQQRNIDIDTVYNYLRALEAACLIYRVPRYDVRSKEILKTHEKYFLSDHSLLYALEGYDESKTDSLLENIVMLELHRRSYNVYTGRSEEREIDFIAEQGDKKIYVQVAHLLADQQTIDREYEPLFKIRDSHPKYVVSMDRVMQDNTEGVRHRNIGEFLSGKEEVWRSEV